MSNQNGDNHDIEPEQLTAYALYQLNGDERAAIKAKLAANGSESAQEEVREIQSLSAAVAAIRNSAEIPTRSAELRKAIEDRFDQVSVVAKADEKPSRKPKGAVTRLGAWGWATIGGVAMGLIALLLLPAIQSYREAARRMQAGSHLKQIGRGLHNLSIPYQSLQKGAQPSDVEVPAYAGISGATNDMANRVSSEANMLDLVPNSQGKGQQQGGQQSQANAPAKGTTSLQMTVTPRIIVQEEEKAEVGIQLTKEKIVEALVHRGRLQRSAREVDPFSQSTSEAAAAQAQSRNDAEVEVAERAIRLSRADLNAQEQIRRSMAISESEHRKYMYEYRGIPAEKKEAVNATEFKEKYRNFAEPDVQRLQERLSQRWGLGTEQYAPTTENSFLSPRQHPLSTFSIDVDTASYANMRRFLTSGRLPPPSAVRIEELVNYFRYDYPQPKAGEPFSVNMEVAECPWALTPALSHGERGNGKHWLLRVGLKGKDVPRAERPQSNLVFLLDVSGSMSDENKLPLLKTAMKLLVGELGENDRVSIVTYAGEAGLKLPPTRGHERERINRVIDSLSAGGSTNGSAGIELAYEQAAAYFVPGGTNRVILCTDGDLNVGITSDDALVKLIKRKATGGTFLTVLGFGEGNLKDAKMEKLADNGNGLYAYIDSVREAKKVLVEQLTGSTITIAKDVKIQIEFNPAQIAAYRLLGYENRVLAAQDFNNDKKDAGEIGAGHTVTALYELVPAGAASDDGPALPGVDPLKYQESGVRSQEPVRSSEPRTPSPEPRISAAAQSTELLTLKLRYKEPDGQTSKLLEYPLAGRGHSFNSASPDLQFAAAVASFGMILRNSQHRGNSDLAAVAETAAASLGDDPSGYRAEFVDLVRSAQSLAR